MMRIFFKKDNKFDKFWTWIFHSRPENLALGVMFCVDFKFEVSI